MLSHTSAHWPAWKRGGKEVLRLEAVGEAALPPLPRAPPLAQHTGILKPR